MTPQLIPWELAVKCEDCHRVSDSTGKCIGCGSVALLNLAKCLDRGLEAELDKIFLAVEAVEQRRGMTFQEMLRKYPGLTVKEAKEVAEAL